MEQRPQISYAQLQNILASYAIYHKDFRKNFVENSKKSLEEALKYELPDSVTVQAIEQKNADHLPLVLFCSPKDVLGLDIDHSVLKAFAKDFGECFGKYLGNDGSAVIAKLCMLVWEKPELRAECVKDPKKFLSDHLGHTLGENDTIECIDQKSTNHLIFILPRMDAELTESDLDMVAGGGVYSLTQNLANSGLHMVTGTLQGIVGPGALSNAIGTTSNVIGGFGKMVTGAQDALLGPVIGFLGL